MFNKLKSTIEKVQLRIRKKTTLLDNLSDKSQIYDDESDLNTQELLESISQNLLRYSELTNVRNLDKLICNLECSGNQCHFTGPRLLHLHFDADRRWKEFVLSVASHDV